MRLLFHFAVLCPVGFALGVADGVRYPSVVEACDFLGESGVYSSGARLGNRLRTTALAIDAFVQRTFGAP